MGVMPRTGLGLIELLVVLAIVVVLGTWFVQRPAGSLASEARALAGAIAHARARAAVGGHPVTVYGSTCGSAPLLRWNALASAVSSPPARGLQFTPDGLPRACDGGLGNATILLEHRGQRAAVIVSSLGRVRWEMR